METKNTPRLNGPDLCSCCGKLEHVKGTLYNFTQKDHANQMCSCDNPYFWRHFIADHYGEGSS